MTGGRSGRPRGGKASRRTTLAATAIALALGSAACERDPPDATPPEEAAAPVEVTRVRIVSAGRSGPFDPDDPLTAVVETRGAADHATLVAVWRDADGRVVSESSRSIAPSGPGSTEFPAVPLDPWPPGSHAVEVWLDGERAGSWTFTVRPPGAGEGSGEVDPEGG